MRNSVAFQGGPTPSFRFPRAALRCALGFGVVWPFWPEKLAAESRSKNQSNKPDSLTLAVHVRFSSRGILERRIIPNIRSEPKTIGPRTDGLVETG